METLPEVQSELCINGLTLNNSIISHEDETAKSSLTTVSCKKSL
jgi:hypothetical protein